MAVLYFNVALGGAEPKCQTKYEANVLQTQCKPGEAFKYLNDYNGGWPSVRLFGCSAAGWSRPATNKSMSSERKRKSLVFAEKGNHDQVGCWLFFNFGGVTAPSRCISLQASTKLFLKGCKKNKAYCTAWGWCGCSTAACRLCCSRSVNWGRGVYHDASLRCCNTGGKC